jgi:hypothetical protein
MKLNEGFFSVELGRQVDSMTDFEKKLDETRHVTGMAKYLTRDFGYNRPAKDEWVERREGELEAQRKQADHDVEVSKEWLQKNK